MEQTYASSKSGKGQEWAQKRHQDNGVSQVVDLEDAQAMVEDLSLEEYFLQVEMPKRINLNIWKQMKKELVIIKTSIKNVPYVLPLWLGLDRPRCFQPLLLK